MASDQSNVLQEDLEVHETSAREYRDHGVIPDFDAAAERGRALAESMLILDPSRKKLVESVYGKQYCMNRYPLAYKPRT
jgi:hypothetical protein